MTDHEQVGDDERDRVDTRIDRWAAEIPGVDLAVEAFTQRIHLLHRALERSLAETTERFGLSVGEYAVLTSLRGSGAPYTMTPSQLADSCALSSGAMTNRLDNLERDRLVRRVRDADDRRGVLVTLTDEGHNRWDEAAGAAAAREALVASALDDDEKEQLNALLRRLVLAFARAGVAMKKSAPT